MIGPLFEISRAEHVIAIAAIRGVTGDIQAAVEIEAPALSTPALQCWQFTPSTLMVVFILFSLYGRETRVVQMVFEW